MENQAERTLQKVLLFLEMGNLEEATKALRKHIENNLESRELIFTSECCLFWKSQIERLSEIESPFERGETLLSEWRLFLNSIIRQHEKVYEPTFRAVCHGIFSLALQNYTQLLDEQDPILRSELLRKIGLCYKKLGEFDNALQCLAEANMQRQQQAAVIADLADCYALCGDDKAAKVLFREAFFIDCKQVDLDFLDSELIKSLISRIEEKGISGELLNAWIPIYGTLWGVFTIRRPLKSNEVIKLRKEIYALENEMKLPVRGKEFQTPRLLNMYFRLIDHCQERNDRELLNETLLKIKILDAAVYNQYVR
ncbi:MAG: hypothetical protein K2H09_06755 [Treponemataceae bacterium]|nr:hypothetical protein [Treponemataceae bacterium]